MTYNLENEHDVQRFKDRCTQLLERGAMVELTAKRMSNPPDQNSYLHVVISAWALEFGYTLEEAKQDIFKRQVNADLFISQKGGIAVCRSVAALSVEERASAIEKWRNWSQHECGFYIPTPEEHKALAAMEAHVKQHRQYL